MLNIDMIEKQYGEKTDAKAPNPSLEPSKTQPQIQQQDPPSKKEDKMDLKALRLALGSEELLKSS